MQKKQVASYKDMILAIKEAIELYPAYNWKLQNRTEVAQKSQWIQIDSSPPKLPLSQELSCNAILKRHQVYNSLLTMKPTNPGYGSLQISTNFNILPSPGLTIHNYFKKGFSGKKFDIEDVAKIMQNKNIPTLERQFLVFLGDYWSKKVGTQSSHSDFWNLVSRVLNYNYSQLVEVWEKEVSSRFRKKFWETLKQKRADDDQEAQFTGQKFNYSQVETLPQKSLTQKVADKIKKWGKVFKLDPWSINKKRLHEAAKKSIIRTQHEFSISKYLKKWCSKCKELCCQVHYRHHIGEFPHLETDDDWNPFTSHTIKFFNTYYANRMKISQGVNSIEIMSHKCRNEIQDCCKTQGDKQYRNSLTLKSLSVLQHLSKFKFENHCFLKKILPEYRCCDLSYIYTKIVKFNKKRFLEKIKHHSIDKKMFCNLISYNTSTNQSRIKEICLRNTGCLGICLEGSNEAGKKSQKSKKFRCDCGKSCTESCWCNEKAIQCDPAVCNCNCSLPYSYSLVTDTFQYLKKKQSVYRANNYIFSGYKPRLIASISKMCDGLGLYTLQKLKKDEFIGLYTGEYIENDTSDGNKEFLTSYLESSYVFNVCEFITLDSILYGNKLRYINHGRDVFLNVDVKTVNINSITYICFFANKNIEAGEELLFNYGNDYQLDWTKVDNAVTKVLSGCSYSKSKKTGRKNRRR